MDNPAQYAVKLLSRFNSALKARDISHAPIQLQHGDFMKSLDVRDALSRAGLVYMNNPKFGPELNLKVLGERMFLLDYSPFCWQYTLRANMH